MLDAEFRYYDTSSPPLYIGWWVAWIAGNILSNVSTRIVFSTTDSAMQNIGTMLVVISMTITMVAAYLLIQIVGNITGRQEETGRRVAANFDTPPLPPNFY